MRYIIRPEDLPAYSPPLPAGTVNRRLVVVEPGGVAERHPRALCLGTAFQARMSLAPLCPSPSPLPGGEGATRPC